MDQAGGTEGHASADGIERELAKWDADPASAEITKTKDALAASDDDEAHAPFRSLAKQLLQTTPYVDRQINAESLAKNVTRASGTPRRPSVYRRAACWWRVRHQHRVEQGLVARLQV